LKLVRFLLHKDLRSSDKSFKCIIYPFRGRFFPAPEHTDLQHKEREYVKTHRFNVEISKSAILD